MDEKSRTIIVGQRLGRDGGQVVVGPCHVNEIKIVPCLCAIITVSQAIIKRVGQIFLAVPSAISFY